MAIYKANDQYAAQLRMAWVSSPPDGSLAVNAIPSNFPTLVTLGKGLATEAVFSVTGYSGTSSSDYTLTGALWVKGYTGTQAANSTVNCLNNEEFFNQYSSFVNDEYLQMAEQSSAPATPASGFVRLYGKTDGKWYIKNDAGTEGELGQLSNEWIDVADAATMTMDLSNIVKRLKFKLGPLTDNRTLAISNLTLGQTFMARIMQDGTGSRTVTWFPVASDTVTMTIANPCEVTTTKDLKTGTPVIFTTTGALPTGITSGTQYYWIRTGATTGNVATSKANAIAGTTITSSGSQSGVHTMKTQIIWSGGTAPTLTTTKYAYDDIGFVVQDVNTITGTVIAQDM